AVTIGSVSYNPLSSLGAEKAVMLVEIYRHNSEWKISAIGQGFSQGLARLIEHLGGEVSANQNEKRWKWSETKIIPINFYYFTVKAGRTRYALKIRRSIR
uniref:TerD family protein n=1 Tax=Enterococcus rotai TaxID=118060 RepID=UPI0035C72DC3